MLLFCTDNNLFTIRHEKSNQCIHVKNLKLLADNCQETNETLWTWVSKHRLFNLGSQKCLRLDASKSLNRVEMVDCDSSLTLWWQCADALIFSASQNKLALKNGVVTASIDSVDTWRRSNSSDIICKQPYRGMYCCQLSFLGTGICMRVSVNTFGGMCLQIVQKERPLHTLHRY